MLQPFHIVVTATQLLLVRAPNAHWRDLQDAFPAYTTSLGPFTLEDALATLVDEWPEMESRSADIYAFAHSEDGDVLDLSAL